MVTGFMAHAFEHHQGFGVGNVEQPGDLVPAEGRR
jgi:hypothetical protein